MPLPWRLVRRALVRDFRVTRAYEAVYADPRDGTEHDRAVFETPDWVNVIALTPEHNVILVRQFRFGAGSVQLETPGGLLEEGEDPAATAARELEEETGFVAGRLVPLGAILPDAAMRTNRAHLFLALDCRRVHAGRQDDGEDIDVELRPWSEIRALVERGELSHAISIAALYLAEPLLVATAAR